MCSLISYKKYPQASCWKPVGDRIEPAAVCVAGRASAGPRLNFLYKNCVRRIILLSLYLINKITFKTYKNEKGNHRPVV